MTFKISNLFFGLFFLALPCFGTTAVKSYGKVWCYVPNDLYPRNANGFIDTITEYSTPSGPAFSVTIRTLEQQRNKIENNPACAFEYYQFVHKDSYTIENDDTNGFEFSFPRKVTLFTCGPGSSAELFDSKEDLAEEIMKSKVATREITVDGKKKVVRASYAYVTDKTCVQFKWNIATE